ncbi:hypothetical protein K438DRAFT_1802908 [Mycena galopus ATCC 62051]|nr:hypothetical protein K438DRAFT_1802908 [Mycena galopus ATCC 62051]
MALGGSSAVHIQSSLPSPLLPPFRLQTLSSITIHPVVLFSILDDYLSRNDKQPRVIGTRSPDNTQIHVRLSFTVLHNENEERPPHLPSAATSPTLAAALLLPLLPRHRQTLTVPPHRSPMSRASQYKEMQTTYCRRMEYAAAARDGTVPGPADDATNAVN